MRLAVLASGRGTNLQAILDEERAGRLGAASVRVVVSDVPGAGCLAIAEAFSVETVVIPRKPHPSREAHEAAVLEALRARSVDAVVLAGYMRLLGPGFLRAFPDRVVNLHPSLLPSFPGLHAQRQALDYGVKQSGCTVHLVDEGTDTGPVILQAAVPIHAGDDEDSLTARIRVEEHRLLPEAIRLLAGDRLERRGRIIFIRDAHDRTERAR